MKWTSEKPTKPGWYWSRIIGEDGSISCDYLDVCGCGCDKLVDEYGNSMDDILDDVQWQGPIKPEDD